MLHTKFQGIRPIGSAAHFKGFYYIWAWRPYWACDLDGLNIFFVSFTPGGSTRNYVSTGPMAFEDMFEIDNM